MEGNILCFMYPRFFFKESISFEPFSAFFLKPSPSHLCSFVSPRSILARFAPPKTSIRDIQRPLGGQWGGPSLGKRVLVGRLQGNWVHFSLCNALLGMTE